MKNIKIKFYILLILFAIIIGFKFILRETHIAEVLNYIQLILAFILGAMILQMRNDENN